MTARDDFEPEPPVPPACRPTVDAVQRLLDGDGPPAAFAADPHLQACRDCSERVRAALLLRSAFAEGAVRPKAPPRATAAIVAAVALDRRTRIVRRRWSYAVCGMAVAACFTVAIGPWATPTRTVQLPAPVSPAKVETPTPPPARIDATLADAGDALENIGRRIAEPTAAAPRVFAPLADALAATPPANPFAADFAPAAEALADLPDAARSGLEPVTDSAYHAFAYLRDMGTPAAAPKN